jgi:DNA sulfur modification protein DndC
MVKADSKPSAGKRPLVFEAEGFTGTIDRIKAEIQELYQADAVPWVIGYSGGKDSTAILQLVWLALQDLPENARTKPVHVISTDTLVENPIVASWVSNSLRSMEQAARDQDLPIVPHRLTPEVTNTFWVGLIGRGYPAPRLKFRWCTERLKIKPSNQFIRDVVQDSGEAVLVLGTRKAESVKRAANMAKHGKHSVRERLTPNASLPNCLIYTPIEDWSNDDVWLFLMRVANCWGHNNKDLLSMYRGASEDGECPLVVDTSTPSCGDSRFGCWVCTLVDKDKSMSAMIQNDREKEWMRPLLDFRNELDFRGERAKKQERDRRDFRRITGKLTYFISTTGEDQLVHGPYNQETRAYWLKKVLEAQRQVHELGPAEVQDLELITAAELHEIRRTWVVDKHEIEDLLPQIYEEALGKPYDGPSIDENLIFDRAALDSLKDECDGGELQFELARTLLNLERRYRTMGARRGLFRQMEDAIERCFFDDEADALERERQRAAEKEHRPNRAEIVSEANQPSLFEIDEEGASG